MPGKASSGPIILAAASIGGHWVQLLRITRGFEERGCEVVYLSTHPKCASMIPADARYEMLPDFNRSSCWRVPGALLKALRILRRVRPDLVVTTGAAPGLVMLMAARLTGRKAIWIDSIANVEHLSMCGRIATRLATATFTQWPELATGRVRYSGNVFGNP